MKRLLLICVLAGCQDIENIGYTGAAASPTEYTTLARGPRYVYDVALDDNYVYWIVNNEEPISNKTDAFRVAKTGGPVEHLAQVDGMVYSFALDEEYLYLPVYETSASGAAFLRVPKYGGVPEVIEDHLRYLDFVAVHDDGVYLAPLVDESTIDYQLWRYPLGGGPHEVLVDGLRGPESLAIVSTNLYVTTAGDSLFHEAPLAGGVSVQPMPSLYAQRAKSDGDRVYLITGAIGDCPSARISAWRPGLPELTDLGAIPSCTSDIAVASPAVFAVNFDAHAVFEYPVDGSGRVTLVDGLTNPMRIVAEPDGSTIYWADFDTGEIDRLDLSH